MVDEGDVNGSPGEGLGGVFCHTVELFSGGAFGVIVFIVDTNGYYNDLGCWDGRGAFEEFHEMVYFGSGVAVQL